MSNFFPQQLNTLGTKPFQNKRSSLSKRPPARHSLRLVERGGLLVLGSGWIVAIAIAGMGLTNFCFLDKEAGYSSGISTHQEGTIQNSKPSSSVPFWICLLLIVSASPWAFNYFRKSSIVNNSKKPTRRDLHSPSSAQAIAQSASRESQWQNILPNSPHESMSPVNSRPPSQPVSFISQEQKPVSYRISRVTSRSSSAVLNRTVSVGAKNIRLPFEQLK
jgi:hypothetical protein